MATQFKWIFILVAFDDPDLEPQVVMERVPKSDDEQLAAFMRGGEVLDVLNDDTDESTADGYRQMLEKKCLRRR